MKQHVIGGLLASFTCLVSSVALAQQPDQAQLLQMLRARMQGNVPAAAPAAPAYAAPAKISEAQLASKIAGWGNAKGPFSTESYRDGFAIQGERVLDPEGNILKFAVDGQTGDASYLMEAGPGVFEIKLMRYRTGAPMTIATATRQMGLWSVETVTGVRASGNRMNLSPRGFSVARDNALFSYTAGEGLKSFGLPEAYVLAAHQNGNVDATKWLLLEKRAETKAAESGALGGTALGQMFGLVKQIGAAVGVNKSDADFALYHLESQKIVPIYIALEEKQANFLSQCRQRNKWVAQCDQLETRASLYGQDGSPNRGHYYWRLSWFQTPRGPIALVMEDGIGKIDAVELATDRRVNVFERKLGIASWSAKQEPTGEVVVSAQLGFDRQSNNDVAKLFEASAAPTAGATSSLQ